MMLTMKSTYTLLTVMIAVFVSMAQCASLVRRSTTAVSASQPTAQTTGCAVKPMEMKVYEPGCGVLTIITKGCHGYCASSSLYTNNDLAVDCQFCRPDKSVMKTAEMKCPLLKAKKKIIVYREALSCRCDGCPWFRVSIISTGGVRLVDNHDWINETLRLPSLSYLKRRLQNDNNCPWKIDHWSK